MIFREGEKAEKVYLIESGTVALEACYVPKSIIVVGTIGAGELRATQIAMKQFDEKMKAMSSGGNLGKIASYRVQQDRQWAEFDRMTKPGTGSQQAVENPEGFAQDQVDLIEKATDLLGENCELVMSDGAYQPAAMARLGSR